MTATLAALESEALDLSPAERILLADRLLASVSTKHARCFHWTGSDAEDVEIVDYH